MFETVTNAGGKEPRGDLPGDRPAQLELPVPGQRGPHEPLRVRAPRLGRDPRPSHRRPTPTSAPAPSGSSARATRRARASRRPRRSASRSRSLFRARPRTAGEAGRLVQSRRQAAAMLARQRVVGAELGEDRDHHAAEQVLALGVLLGGEDTLQLPSACSASPRPRPRTPPEARPRSAPFCGWESSARAASPSATKSCGNARQQLAAHPSGSPRPSRMRPRPIAAGAWRGSSSSALRSDSSSSDESASRSASEGTIRLRKASILRRRDGADELGDHLAVLERLDGGDALDLELLRDRWIRVGVELDELDSPSRRCTASSRAGPSVRQGPHHSAQKSTTTGTCFERSTTLSWKSCSLTSLVMSLSVPAASVGSRGRRPPGDACFGGRQMPTQEVELVGDRALTPTEVDVEVLARVLADFDAGPWPARPRHGPGREGRSHPGRRSGPGSGSERRRSG